MATHHRTSSNKRVPNPISTAAVLPGIIVTSKSSRNVTHARHRSIPLGKKSKAAKKQEPAVESEDDDMATSFLNFCAVCGNQIVHPDHSYLYCSEKCRKQDCNSSWMSQVQHSPPVSPFTTEFDDTTPVRDVVPQWSPRPPGLITRFSNTSISSDESDPWSDLDHKDAGSPTQSIPRRESEATRSLRLFQSYTSMSSTVPNRPRPSRSSTSTSLTPSLSDSPTSTPGTTCGFSLPYYNAAAFMPSARPLPPRANALPRSDLLVQPSPYHSTSNSATPTAASTSLSSTTTITPANSETPSRTASHPLISSLKTAPLASTTTEFFNDADMIYQRVPLRTTDGEGTGSLKQLFSFDQMQAPPTGSSPSKRFGRE